MNTTNKAAIAAIAGIGILFALKKKAPPVSDQTFSLAIYDSSGNRIASSYRDNNRISGDISAFPGALTEGGTGYSAVVSVTNTSKYPDLTLAPYTFIINCAAGVNQPVGSYFINGLTKTLSLGPGASGTVSFPFAIPYGMNGAGSAAAILETAAGNVLQTATATFVVTPATITPGGTILF